MNLESLENLGNLEFSENRLWWLYGVGVGGFGEIFGCFGLYGVN